MAKHGIRLLFLVAVILAPHWGASGQLVESPPNPSSPEVVSPPVPAPPPTAPVPAASSAIDGPDTIPAFRLGRFAAPSGAESAAWLVMPTGAADVESLDGGRRLIIAAPPGQYTLVVVSMAAGQPTIVTKDVEFQTASDGGTTPSPDEGSAPLQKEIEAASREYLRGIPKVLRQAAADVASGKIVTVDALRDSIAAGRQAAAAPLSGRLAVQWQGAIGGDGVITDKAKIQQSLINSAKAMEDGLVH